MTVITFSAYLILFKYSKLNENSIGIMFPLKRYKIDLSHFYFAPSDETFSYNYTSFGRKHKTSQLFLITYQSIASREEIDLMNTIMKQNALIPLGGGLES